MIPFNLPLLFCPGSKYIVNHKTISWTPKFVLQIYFSLSWHIILVPECLYVITYSTTKPLEIVLFINSLPTSCAWAEKYKYVRTVFACSIPTKIPGFGNIYFSTLTYLWSNWIVSYERAIKHILFGTIKVTPRQGLFSPNTTMACIVYEVHQLPQ